MRVAHERQIHQIKTQDGILPTNTIDQLKTHEHRALRAMKIADRKAARKAAHVAYTSGQSAGYSTGYGAGNSAGYTSGYSSGNSAAILISSQLGRVWLGLLHWLCRWLQPGLQQRSHERARSAVLERPERDLAARRQRLSTASTSPYIRVRCRGGKPRHKFAHAAEPRFRPDHR